MAENKPHDGPDVFHCGYCGDPQCGFGCVEEMEEKRKIEQGRLKQEWTARYHRLFPHSYKRHSGPFKLPWKEGPLMDTTVPRVNEAIRVQGGGSQLVFDFDKGACHADILATARDLLIERNRTELRSVPGELDFKLRAAIFHVQAAVAFLDEYDMATGLYADSPLERSMPFEEREKNLAFAMAAWMSGTQETKVTFGPQGYVVHDISKEAAARARENQK